MHQLPSMDSSFLAVDGFPVHSDFDVRISEVPSDACS